MNFNHNEESFHIAIGIDEEQHTLLTETLSEISLMMYKRDKLDKPMTKSEVAELLANTLSYKELVYVATSGMFSKTEKAGDAYEKFKRLVSERGIDPQDQEAIKELIEEVGHDADVSVKRIEIDPTDIDGSLDRAGVPDDLRGELKLRILKELTDKLRGQ
jgi:DNA-directed RNA polymerase subunit F